MLAKIILFTAAIALLLTGLSFIGSSAMSDPGPGTDTVGRVVKSDAEWRKILTPMQYYITRQKGTERAYTGKYHDHKADGVYVCVACGLELFDSKHKYDSKTGWPSFYQPIKANHVKTKPDNTFFMRRTEVLCARCDAHLGHVFKDGPPPTGLRYCINSAALNFVARKDAAK